MNFISVLEKFREQIHQGAYSQRDKGERFEILIQRYLKTDHIYTHRFKNVWLWDEFPYNTQLGSIDTGIDIVTETYAGEYWAVQCKCYEKSTVIEKPKVDSFISTSGRSFTDKTGETKQFTHRLWVSTSDNWGANAEESIQNQKPAVSRIGVTELEASAVDWGKIYRGIFGEGARQKAKKPFEHQLEAIEKCHTYFKTHERGKLIMACGTGKTFTSLKIAEKETDNHGMVLFLVPSIALLGQTLREWSNDSTQEFDALCICSDAKVSRKVHRNKDKTTESIIDLAVPATTNTEEVLTQYTRILESCKQRQKKNGLVVFFSTYQSIDVVTKAQQKMKAEGMPHIFDLVICDEAHRTTGVTLQGDDESSFVKVHDNQFIETKKRLYMTATPRLYDDNSKTKAKASDSVLCSMDDTALYGEEIYHIGFGEAVEKDLLSDYKVLILTVNEQHASPAFQNAVSKADKISTNDPAKIFGCMSAFAKKIMGDEGVLDGSDPRLMKRAVAFTNSIDNSRDIRDMFNALSDEFTQTLSDDERRELSGVSAAHVDGSMGIMERETHMGWLKEESNECRVLTNVRCLSEGVDVPSLDAVLFLSAKNSQIDIVQAVGRVMRKAPNKKYGYIIIPIVVPSHVAPEKSLDKDVDYKIVWSVLNGLRAHDDRFGAMINKIDFNVNRPANMLIGKPDHFFDSDGNVLKENAEDRDATVQLSIEFEELKNVIYARLVEKVGDRFYWEQWAREVAVIAQRQVERITHLVEKDSAHRDEFQNFLSGLQRSINPSITEHQAIEMLSQHLITRPVFEALFAESSFVDDNPISQSMQGMIDMLEDNTLKEDLAVLDKFYESIKKKAGDIDNAEGRQRIIVRLYDNFFKIAFPKMVEQLGIVYTPVEVVDFIICSVNDVLQKEFKRSISDQGVHILDPFTGTGTFITRLLESGLIKHGDLKRKYRDEIHANEIVLLAYYIAAVNIENVYHGIMREAGAKKKDSYQTFGGMVLTDTFQLGETDDVGKLSSYIFEKNSERVTRQRKAPLRIIMGNPPYSVGQSSMNDNAQNQRYEKLENYIAESYVHYSAVTNKNSLYDSYIKAFRWSSNRIDPKHGGVICFVSNGAWIDSNSADGFRRSLEEEFSSVYVFNLRGNQRTSGEVSRKEGGKIFGSGSRTPIAITLLVKNPHNTQKKAKIYYYDIGDYLSRDEKLSTITKKKSMIGMKWQRIRPNEHADWINQRNEKFDEFIPMGSKSHGGNEAESNTFFLPVYGRGVATSRDAWVYNFSETALQERTKKSISFYNSQVVEYQKAREETPSLKVEDFIDWDAKKFKWGYVHKMNDIPKGIKYSYEKQSIVQAMYRPFQKQFLYFNKNLNDATYQMPKVFPTHHHKNRVICISAAGSSKDFSALIVDVVPDLHLNGDVQCFPLYYYEEPKSIRPNIDNIFSKQDKDKYVCKEGLTGFILEQARQRYSSKVTKEDIFYYVYGFLHNEDFKREFSSDLKKRLARLPLVEQAENFWAYSQAGRALAELHLNYEQVEPCSHVHVELPEKITADTYTVSKMRFPKKDEKDRIIYNGHIKLSNIPEEAYQYIVNGKSAVEWIMERYSVVVHKDSNIPNNPNDWSKENNNPSYILDLLLSVIQVSVKTVEIVATLPKVKF